jgi:hypothetical protein
LRHGRNQPGQLDVNPFIFEEAPMHGHEKRQVTHGITGQRKFDFVGAQRGTVRGDRRNGYADRKGYHPFFQDPMLHYCVSFSLGFA